MIAAASEIVVTTMTGAIEFGSTCVSRVRKRETPSAVDAITKSDCLTRSTSDRRMREVDGHEKAPIASEITHTVRFAEKTLMTTTAARM